MKSQRIAEFRLEGGPSELPVAKTTFLPPAILSRNERSSRQSNLGSDHLFNCRVRRGFLTAKARISPRMPMGDGMSANTASAVQISRASLRPLPASQNGKRSHVSQGDLGSHVRATTEIFFPEMGLSPIGSPAGK
jgi:hypothetical protein